jgi:hypothetical protein
MMCCRIKNGIIHVCEQHEKPEIPPWVEEHIQEELDIELEEVVTAGELRPDVPRSTAPRAKFAVRRKK